MKKILLFLVILFGVSSYGWTNYYVENTPYGPINVAEINLNNFQQKVYATQQQSQWCWAACISMVFSFYGHPVSQSRIAASIYGIGPNGIPPNSPAAGSAISKVLNREWIDDNGVPFRSRVTALYDAQYNINQISNQFIIKSLKQNEPVILCGEHHAMILANVKYFNTPFGPNVQAATVFDPWPWYKNSPYQGYFHPLPMNSIVPLASGGALSFLAACEVESL